MDERSIAALCAAHGPVESAGRFPPGTIFGDWRVTAFVGRGGNGEVYCAEHVRLGTPAAVKVMIREDERAKTRFLREAKLLAGLKSEAFPRFFAYGEADGRLYLAMELLEPGDLPTGERAIARFLLKVCDAVAELHAHGLVHRDIKPANILWRTGGPRARATAVPVLADLGLVKGVRTSDAGRSTSDITVGGVGTPGYGAPEQMARGEATPAADIHALGVLADRCFGGHPPRAWARIVERATSSIPDRRYPSVAAFARAIRRRHWPLRTILAIVGIGLLSVVGSALRGRTAFDEHLRPVQAEHAVPAIPAPAQAEHAVPAIPVPAQAEHAVPAIPVPVQAEHAVPAIPVPVRAEPEPVHHDTSSRLISEDDERVREGAIWRSVCRPSKDGGMTTIELRGANLVFRTPLVLEADHTYRICGPGRLEADLTCAATTSVQLVSSTIVNHTLLRGKNAGIFYHLDDGSYLNFINQRPMGGERREFITLGKGMNFFRFGGPLTLEKLLDDEKRRGIFSATME